MPPRPTTPTKLSAFIKHNSRCILQKDIEVKVEEPSIYLEVANKVYRLPKGSEVVTRGDPTPAILTGSTEPLSIHNASYRFFTTMNLTVYEPISEQFSYRLNLFRHSNLQPLDATVDTSIPFPKGTIVSVKTRVVDAKGEEQAPASQLLRILCDLPFSPRAGIPIKGHSLSLQTSSYTVEKVVKGKRDFRVYNFLKIMHADLLEVQKRK